MTWTWDPRAWLACRRGNVGMIFALAAPMVIGAAATMGETGFDYWKQNRLQQVADAAAYAAAIEKRGGSPYDTVNTVARTSATTNGWSSGSGAIDVNIPPTSGAYTGASAVEVILTENLPRFFTAAFSSSQLTARARAVAIYQTAANACVLALNANASRAVEVQGNARLVLNGCDVMADSVANDALFVWGSSTVSAECAMSAGGIANKNNITLTGCAAAITQAPRVGDPFSGVPTPSPGSAQTIPKNPKGPVSLSPGSYTNGMDLSGTVTLQPGVYYVSGGDFILNGNASVSGSGVTIYLASGSHVSMNGNSTVQLSAPTSGTYSGILFFGARSGTGSNTFNGDGSSSLTGDLYFPTQDVSYNGNFSGSGGCTHIVADTVAWSGNTTLAVNCSNQGMTPIPARQTVRLVE